MTTRPSLLTAPLGFDPAESEDSVPPPSRISPLAPQTEDIAALVKRIESEIPTSLRRPASRVPRGDAAAVCIDRGSGCGDNSHALTDAFARVARRTTRLPVMTYCNEKFPAAFASLAARSIATPRPDRDQVPYRGMICGSFLDRLLPDSSVDLVTSNAALHWLDLDHVDTIASIPPSASIESTLRQIAAAQWRRLLDSVASELRPGGKMIVSFLARDESRPTHAPLVLLDAAIRQVAGDGFQRHPIALAVPIPIYPRSEAEIMAPFRDRLSVPLPLHLDHCRIESIACPYDAQFLSRGDVSGFAAAYTAFIRAFSSPRLVEWLGKWFPAAVAREIATEIYDQIRAQVLRDPERYKMRKSRAIVVATKD